MSEQAPRESARDKLLRNTAGLVLDKFMVPNDGDYVPVRGESRPISLQEPYALFVQPEQPESKPYLYRLKTNANENVLMSLYGEPPYEPDTTREKSYKKVYQAGLAKGYEQGRQSASDEITRLNEEIVLLNTTISELTAEVEALRTELAELRATLPVATAESERTVPPADPTPTPEQPPAEVAPADPATTETVPADDTTTTAATTSEETAAATATVAEIPPAGDEAAPATSSGTTPEEPQHRGWRNRRRERRETREVRETNRRGRLLGAVAVGALVGAIAVEIIECKFFGHSHSREMRHHFQDQLVQIKAQNAAEKTRDAAEAKLATSRFNTEMSTIAANHAQDVANHQAEMDALAQLHNDHTSLANSLRNGLGHVFSRGGHAKHLVDVGNAQANTITAHSPADFQKNVAQLLRGQGLHVSGDTPHRLAQMSDWMHDQQIASGVNSDHSQHLVEFSAEAFKNPSHETGFKIGADGSGAGALHGWINHAKSIGIKISA